MGHIRVMTSYPELDKVDVKTYRVLDGELSTSADSQFSLSYDMGGLEQTSSERCNRST